MDPVTIHHIATNVANLIPGTVKLAVGIYEFIQEAKDFPSNLKSIQNVLDAIVELLQSLYQDLSTRSQTLIPPELEIRVNKLVSTGEETMANVSRILVSYKKGGVGKYTRFLVSGKEDLEKAKQQLESLKTSLAFVVNMITL